LQAVFVKAFGKRNIFDSETDMYPWLALRPAFQHLLMTESSLNNAPEKINEIVADYLDKIAQSNGEIDLKDLPLF